MSSSSFSWSKDRATDGNEVQCHSRKKLYTKITVKNLTGRS